MVVGLAYNYTMYIEGLFFIMMVLEIWIRKIKTFTEIMSRNLKKSFMF